MSEGRPPFATRARKRELCLHAELRIEKDSDRTFLSPKFIKYFLETTFLYVLCYSDHYEPKIFGKNENFDYKINKNCPIGITKISKK